MLMAIVQDKSNHRAVVGPSVCISLEGFAHINTLAQNHTDSQAIAKLIEELPVCTNLSVTR